jgi:hypothetical protein
MAKSPVKGKYDREVDSGSAYEVLQKRTHDTAASGGQPGAPGSADGQGDQASGGPGWLTTIGGMVATIFGTNNPRRNRLTTGQLIARQVTRSVTNQVAGKIVGELGKSVGGSLGNTVGRAIVRGTLGGILRR